MTAVYAPVARAKSRAGPYEDSQAQVYVGNLPYKLKWQELKDHFKAVGEVENARILTEDGTEWGRSRGVGIVRFKSEGEAQAAIAQLNESELQGRNILVDAWTGSSGKWKQELLEKGQLTVKGAGGWPTVKGAGGKGVKGKGKGGKMQEVRGENLVYIGNLAYEVQWQDLKDHMKGAGTVEFVSVPTEDGTEWGKSKGYGCVRYSSPAEVEQAISTLSETELKGRRILVDRWTSQLSEKGQLAGKGAGGWSAVKGAGGKWGKGKAKGGKSPEVRGENLVYVGNLAYEVQWQDLKDHMKGAGTVEFVSVPTEDGAEGGKSKGYGVVRYSSQAEVQQAISTLSETELKGRRILVDHWTSGGKGKAISL